MIALLMRSCRIKEPAQERAMRKGESMAVDPDELSAKIERLIRKGTLDDHLRELSELMWERRKFLMAREAYDMVMTVGIGDTIRIRDGIKPRYLEGEVCVVTGLSPKRRSGVPMVRAEFKRGPVGKFYSGTILLPGSAFTLIKRAESLVINGQTSETVTLVQ